MSTVSTSPQLIPAEREVERLLTLQPDVETVEMLLTDTNGVIRGKWAPPSTLSKVFDGGVQLPLSLFGLDVWGREVPETGLHIETGDRDGNCYGVPGSLLPVTWARRPTAQVLMTMHEPDGTPFFADPRHRLASVLERFREKNLNPVVAFELEFYLLRPGFETEAQASPLPVSHGRGGPERQRMYSIAELSSQEDFFASLREAAAAQNIPIDTIISEAGPGQFEVNLVHRADAMAAADDALLLRRMIGGVARRHGLRASFMAKPFQEWPGNGMHVHVSLTGADGLNVFGRGEEGERALRSAIAGTLATMPDCLALFINTFNGFRRLAPGSYAPTRVTWGSNNRSVAVRVPISKPEANRLEHRIAGADANPYLVLAAVLSGMLHGMEEKLDPPAAVEGNAYEGDGQGAELTDYMEEAVEAFEASSFIIHAFGARFRHLFTELKKAEQAVFDERISRLEHETYL
ncbi:glutamine synthetase family protein [Lutibaculum baratangense]|uniref:Glutamine synthetase family protein n=1 Tax=Lutibaculum baratangense AMV1 TaxID=631454 RepID=V4RE70_9HYPH|nr:glutamine synthetase family protein [Lutibaculum baratangense]ESR23689.1 glutamine synthetase family protein [Lutibaculum baratangense AMV1]